MNASEAVLFPWCPELERLYSSRSVIGRTGKEFKNVAPLSTRNNIDILRTCIMDRKPSRTLETGMAFGGSALTIASCHKDFGRTGSNIHTAIDLTQSPYWDNVAQDGLSRAGLSDLVRTIEQPSANALAALHALGEKLDFCYEDGSHQFKDVFVDFYFVARMFNIGAFVLFDDSSDVHIAKVLKFIRRNYAGVFAELDVNRYITKKRVRLRRQVGQLVGRIQMVGFEKIKDQNASLRFIDY